MYDIHKVKNVSGQLAIRRSLTTNQAEPDEPSGRTKRPFVGRRSNEKPNFPSKIFVFPKIIHIFAAGGKDPLVELGSVMLHLVIRNLVNFKKCTQDGIGIFSRVWRGIDVTVSLYIGLPEPRMRDWRYSVSRFCIYNKVYSLGRDCKAAEKGEELCESCQCAHFYLL